MSQKNKRILPVQGWCYQHPLAPSQKEAGPEGNGEDPGLNSWLCCCIPGRCHCPVLSLGSSLAFISSLLKCLQMILLFSPDFFFLLWVSLARLVEIGCKLGFLLRLAHTPEAFLQPLHQFRGFKCVSKYVPIGASINHLTWNMWLETVFQWELSICLNSALF